MVTIHFSHCDLVICLLLGKSYVSSLPNQDSGVPLGSQLELCIHFLLLSDDNLQIMDFWIGDDVAEIENKHVQNIKYVRAVETLHTDFKNDLLKSKVEHSKKLSIEKLIATGHCDFNELRQAVKSLSQPVDTHRDEESSNIVFYSQKNNSTGIFYLFLFLCLIFQTILHVIHFRL